MCNCYDVRLLHVCFYFPLFSYLFCLSISLSTFTFIICYIMSKRPYPADRKSFVCMCRMLVIVQYLEGHHSWIWFHYLIFILWLFLQFFGNVFFPRSGGNPRCINLYFNSACHTLSNTFATSCNTTNTLFPSARFYFILFFFNFLCLSLL